MTTFLSLDELAVLTGRKRKAHQIAALRQQGVPFFVNAVGRPVVVRTALTGGTPAAPAPAPEWRPRVLTNTVTQPWKSHSRSRPS